MSDHTIQLVLLFVNSVALAALVWYVVETCLIRRSAQEQVEGMAKPCLTLFAKLRNPDDAILGMHDAIGGTEICADDGNFVVQNIGTGVALNVTYYFENLDSPGDTRRRDKSYFINVLQGQKIRMPEPINASPLCGNCRLIFQFESIRGKRYRSTVTMNHHVLTAFNFKGVKT